MSSRVLKTAILVPVFNKLEYTRKCLESLDASIRGEDLSSYFDIVVIDDGSTDHTTEFIRNRFPDVHVLNGDGNLWWSGGINAGAVYARDHLKSDFVLLWNNDIACEAGYFKVLVDLQKKLKGREIVGSTIYMDQSMTRTWSMGGKFNARTGVLYMIGYDKPVNSQNMEYSRIEWLPGMGTLIPVKVINHIGFWDQVNFPQYHGDLEFTYRAFLKGYDLIVDPNLKIVNDPTNSSMGHDGNFGKFVKLFTDRRSLYNFKVNTIFIKKYGVGPFRYSYLMKMYIILTMSFIKHTIARLSN